MTLDRDELEDLVSRTRALMLEMEALDDMAPALETVQAGMHEFERSEDVAVDVLLPTEAAAAGFLRVRSPKAFVFSVICADERVREEVRLALSAGPSAVVGTVVGLLTLGAGVAVAVSAVGAIAVGIAALVLTKGLDEACAKVSR